MTPSSLSAAQNIQVEEEEGERDENEDDVGEDDDLIRLDTHRRSLHEYKH